MGVLDLKVREPKDGVGAGEGDTVKCVLDWAGLSFVEQASKTEYIFRWELSPGECGQADLGLSVCKKQPDAAGQSELRLVI